MLRVRNPAGWGRNELNINTFNFPDGEPHLSSEISQAPICIEATIASSDDLMRVLMLNDILRHNGAQHVNLFIAYLMGARMDRRMPAEEFETETFPSRDKLGRDKYFRYHPFTLGIISELILTAHFDHITILDPHSDVAPALLHAEAKPPDTYVTDAISLTEPTALVAPDAGAAKKVQRLGEIHNLPVIQALKKRDPQTGRLSGCQVVIDNPGLHALSAQRLLIVDDICDGGRTFVNLANELRSFGAPYVALYVTHGIFSAALPLKEIDQIVTTNSYREQPQHSFLHTIHL